MAPLSRDYSNSKAPGALFAILLTLGVNIGLFAVLGWVNKRPDSSGSNQNIQPIHHINIHKLPPPKTQEKSFTLRKKQPHSPRQLRPSVKRHTPRLTPATMRPITTPPCLDIDLALPSLTFAPNRVARHMSQANETASLSGTEAADNGIMNESDVEIPPKPTYSPSPRYPMSARKLGHSGNVVIGLIISKEGLPYSLKVKASSGHRSLDASALRAVKTWRFTPAQDNGVKVKVHGSIDINFRLQGRD